MSALARTWVSAKAALAAERARGVAIAPALEPAFLPAAIEVIERPVSPTARRTAQILLGGLAATGLWLVVGTVDVVAAAPGQTVPRAHVKLVQSVGGGVVRRIYVREGEHVRAGQPLADLDPTVAGADEAEASRALLAAELDVARGRAVVAGLSGQDAAYTPPPGTPADVVATQRALVAAEIATATAATAGLADARRAALADAQAASAQHQALAASSPMLDRQVEAIHTLAAKGYASKLRLLDMQRQQQSERGNLAAAAAQRAHALAEAERDAHELARTHEDALKAALTTLANAEHEVEGRRAELAKASLRRSRQRLVAPVEGTVEQLAIHTEGGVVPAVQPLMAIVPYGAMMVEARVQNRDAGFVKPGQPVAVRFDAFPFTRYGSVTGRVVSIAREAVGDGRSAGVYRAEVAIDGNATTTGQTLPLRAGMAATVDIRLGARRLITYLIDPVATTLGEAARER